MRKIAKYIKEKIDYCILQIVSLLSFIRWRGKKAVSINLCGEGMKDYVNVSNYYKNDVALDLSRWDLPFASNSAKKIICISAINYFSRKRAEELVKECYRVLAPGGVARFGVQDLKEIARRYVANDRDFFFQTNPQTGRQRFKGKTIGDMINSWFYGYGGLPHSGKYMYDYETLALFFKDAGFSKIEQKEYMQSALADVDVIDNRPDQMFFLEAVK